MPDDRSLHLRFVVDAPDDLAPEDFVGLFECADEFARHVVQQAALELFTELDLPEEWRLGTLQRIRQLGRRVPVPARVVSVERGSWVVETLLGGAAVLWFLKNYVHPVVQDAWDDSRLRQRIVEFLRDRVFRGARRGLEQKAIESPRFRRLQIQSVSEPEDPSRDESHIVICLERREIIEVRMTDQELLEHFVRRLQGDE